MQDADCVMGFEQEIIEESQLHKVSVFWNYFQRWKAYYPMEQAEKKMGFEQEIIEESQLHKVSVFWNYFQRWKAYYPMEQAEKKRILSWAEKTVYSRADAIVSGKHRNQYAEVAVLPSMVGEIKQDMGTERAREEIFAEYKRKYPRHSSFQKEIKYYFVVK